MRICLVTTGQPSTNPRLVKEADALEAEGHDVHVIGAHWADWAEATDRSVLKDRAWTCQIVDWRRGRNPGLFWRSRVRNKLASVLIRSGVRTPSVDVAALQRLAPELTSAAAATRADFYIAHNIGALPAALHAARRHRAKAGFDAEDFHSGQFPPGGQNHFRDLARRVEQQLIPQCAYVTAASPGIAAAYEELCRIPRPTVVLNVFTLAERPAALRPTETSGRVELYWFSQTIGPARGIEQAVQALAILPQRVTLHLRGEWQAGYEAQIRQLARELGVAQERIASYPPVAPGLMVHSAALHDVGLALEPGHTPNNDLALSNKAFTYLMAGSALLATRTQAQGQLAKELGDAAVLCEPGSGESMAAALLPWVEDRSLLQRARQEAWNLAGERFNWDQEQYKFLGAMHDAASNDVADSPWARRTHEKPAFGVERL